MKKVLHALQSLEKWIIVIAFVIMVVAIFCQVVNRNIFKIPVSGFEEAAKYLRENNSRVSEAAAFMGFDDYNYFSKIFKSEMGLSPLEYKKRMNIQEAKKEICSICSATGSCSLSLICAETLSDLADEFLTARSLNT